MRSGNRTLTIMLLAGAFALPAQLACAQTVKKPAPEQAGAAKKDPNVALKALEAGSKAYSSGKLEPAIQSLTAALANGGLPPPKMAQAYYYRGLSYKKQKKPAQALSDLTVAVWVNGGLNESERAAAMDARNEVYREAGLGDQAPPIANAVGTPAPAPAATAAAAPAAAPTPPPAVAAPPPVAPPPVVAAAPPPTATPAMAPFSTEATPAATAERPVWQADPNAPPPPPMQLPADAPPPASAAAPPAPPASGPVAVLSNSPETTPASPPPMTPVSSLAAEPVSEQPAQQSTDMMAPLANAGSSISGFFSNMFGGSSASETPPATGSTGAADGPGWVKVDQASGPQGPAAQVSASEPQRAPGFEVASVNPSSPPAPTASVSAAPPKAPKSAAGKYRLQLATVRSREEADRVVQMLMSSHASELGGAEADVDETVIGNMGTFYRVRLGPYANATDPKKLCVTLKPQGFDCQVVTQ